MKTKILGIALFGLTLAAVTYYPQLMANNIDTEVQRHITAKPRIDVVFVLDTTGSMGGLIQTAKEKIWSIATTMASAQQAPEIRIGLVAYRDRGDAYVTRVVDLSSDLDSVYATLMDFQADGGGDGPESVNKALYDAVHNISWSEQDQAYQVIFLVGDAPPHMDYNEVRYPEIIAAATNKGIVVNTIQCGDMPMTVEPWSQIAALSNGEFFQVEQAGGAVAFNTPFDEKIAELSAELDSTRLYYGSEEDKDRMKVKVAATEKMHAGLSAASRARRAEFNASEGGKTNLLGENELVSAVADGRVALDDLDAEALPASLRAMAPEEQVAYVAATAEKRESLQRQIRELSEERGDYIAKKVDEAGGMKASLDQKLYDAVKDQASEAGLEYKDGPAY
ncbi:MAG: VWA domain-containing protein [Gammaproteobacteria bacterium]|nr:VWA domain-containing protein [Gammaproteobacteria bacterium]MDH5260609.1 VWA domain-containing protein [Gammaproteobacteria bacterium]MDH5582717.1 VWA domain-containing protein [Gammaproteobacteria bacterium]